MKICWKQILKKYYDKEASGEKTNKLVLNVMDKRKFYLEHGLKLKKVHRAISFNQSNCLKPFIEFNTEKKQRMTLKKICSS